MTIWREKFVKSMLSSHPKGSLETGLLLELEQRQYKTDVNILVAIPEGGTEN